MPKRYIYSFGLKCVPNQCYFFTEQANNYCYPINYIILKLVFIIKLKKEIIIIIIIFLTLSIKYGSFIHLGLVDFNFNNYK